MPSEYLSVADYPEYGLASDAAPQVRRASAVIDGYLKRPEGMAWMPDSFGRPAYMAASNPALSLPLGAAIQPGTAVVIPFAFPGYDIVGEVFILDRGNTSLCEPVTVTSVDIPNGTVTLGRVLRAHDVGATMESGLVIVEDRQIPDRRSIARVTRPQLTALISAVGRYGYGRRSDRFGAYINEINLLATLQSLGGEQVWQPIDVGTVSISSTTGECWITPGMMLAYFTEVRLRYVAGFPASAVPQSVKQATANVVANLAASSDNDLSPIFKVMQAGGTRLERMSDGFIDADTGNLLAPFKVRAFV